MGSFIDVQVEGNTAVDSLTKNYTSPGQYFSTIFIKVFQQSQITNLIIYPGILIPQNMFAKFLVQVSYYPGLVHWQ